MGTKVQCKSYFPGYYFMRDLNEDADSGSWPVYHGDKMLMGRQCHTFLPRPTTDGHSEYDKELLRRTMLMHEATFKDQVAELHRLYRIQRNLMEELKRKEMHNYTIPMNVSQLVYHSSSSQMQSEDARKMWDISGKPSCSRASFSGTDNMQSPSELMRSSSMQGHTVASGSFNDCRSLESNFKKFPRRMFDLQLPADQYIDDEEGEHIEEKKVLTVANNVNLSLGSGGNLKCQGESSNSDLSFRNKQSLADLNHPILNEEAASSASVSNFLGHVACRSDTQVQDTLQQNSGSLGLPREFFQNTPRGMNNGAHSNALLLENTTARLERPTYNLENGQSRSKLNNLSQDFGPERFATISKPIQVEYRNAQLPPFLMDDQRMRGSRRESENCGTEMSKSSERLANQSFSRAVLVPDTPSTSPVVPDVTESRPSSSFSSWKKPTSSLIQSSIAVQALHCSNSSAQLSKISEMSIPKNGVSEAQWHFNGHPRSNTNFASGISYADGFLYRSQNQSHASEDRLAPVGFDYLNGCRDNASTSGHFEGRSTTKYLKGSECMDVKSAKDLNLNVAIPNGFAEGMVPQRENLIVDGERKNKDPVGGLPWLRMKPACNDGSGKGRGGLNQNGICLTQYYSHQSTLIDGIEKVHTSNSVQDSSSISMSCDAEGQRIQKSDSLTGKKILGFPIFDEVHVSEDYASLGFSSKTLHNLSKLEFIPNGGKFGTLSIDLTCDPSLLASGQKLSSENVAAEKDLDNNISSVKHHFNLNSCADEEEPCTYSIPRENVRIEIDLEAPAVPESSEVTPSEEESQVDQLKIPALSSSQVELEDPTEDLAKIVAEAMIIMSSSTFHFHLEDVTSHLSETSVSDSLRWFADIVSSHTEGLQGKNEVIRREKDNFDGGESASNDSDYFETMTLKLTETEVDEYLCRPWAPEPLNEEEACPASLLPTRRRRGQGKRGRQRRDFQRDILPGLASLSRQEVSEDIQVIGGLMRATGHPWQSGVARRNAARNGWARGRRRTRNVTPAVAATIVCSPPRQQGNNSEVGLEERSLTGWGKTTRRPRRQRLAAGNISIPITQV